MRACKAQERAQMNADSPLSLGGITNRRCRQRWRDILRGRRWGSFHCRLMQDPSCALKPILAVAGKNFAAMLSAHAKMGVRIGGCRCIVLAGGRPSGERS